MFVTDSDANAGFCKLGASKKQEETTADKEPFAAWLAILILSLQTDNTTHNATTRRTRTRATQ